MNRSDVVAVVRQIKDGFDRHQDDESAHSAEDQLYEDVLVAIAGGAPFAAELAAEALKTRALKFARWCA